jgi:phage-related protein
MICWIFRKLLSIRLEPLSALRSLAGNIQARNLGEDKGPGVFEVVEDRRADTYRAVYCVKFESAIYVFHAFQKKSPSGIKTARKDIELIARRLNEAKADYEVRYGKESK